LVDFNQELFVVLSVHIIYYQCELVLLTKMIRVVHVPTT